MFLRNTLAETRGCHSHWNEERPRGTKGFWWYEWEPVLHQLEGRYWDALPSYPPPSLSPRLSPLNFLWGIQGPKRLLLQECPIWGVSPLRLALSQREFPLQVAWAPADWPPVSLRAILGRLFNGLTLIAFSCLCHAVSMQFNKRFSGCCAHSSLPTYILCSRRF